MAGNTATAKCDLQRRIHVKLLVPQPNAVRRGSLAGVALQLVDAAGVNVSSPSRVVTVAAVKSSTGATIAQSLWNVQGSTFAFGLGAYGYARPSREFSASIPAYKPE